MIRLVQGQLELSNSRYSTAIDGPAAALSVSGGGTSRVFRIDPGVTASLSGLTITGGAGVLMGGGVANEGTATLYGCTISGDSASVGGGVSNQDRTTLTDCTVSGDQGSGLVNLAGDLVMTGCTISGNTSAKYGGGILNESRLALTGCTVSGNSALYGGGLDAPSSTATLNDTIVAGNVDARGASDIVGRFAARVTGGYDLIGPGGSGGIDNGSDGDIVLANLAGLGLAPLANNGGPTLTMALLPGSPAINAGSDALEVDSDGVLLAADQRGSGFPRVVAGTADVGAYEYPYLTTRISLVASGGATSTYGQSVTLTATIVIIDGGTGVPAGLIEFFDGRTRLGSVTLDGSGKAVLTTSALGIGSRSITATYGGDAGSTAATSGAIAVSVAQAGAQAELVPHAVLGKKNVVELDLEARIEPLAPGGGGPTGTVSFELIQKKVKVLEALATRRRRGDAGGQARQGAQEVDHDRLRRRRRLPGEHDGRDPVPQVAHDEGSDRWPSVGPRGASQRATPRDRRRRSGMTGSAPHHATDSSSTVATAAEWRHRSSISLAQLERRGEGPSILTETKGIP